MMPDLEVLLEIDSDRSKILKLNPERDLESINTSSTVLPSVIVTWIVFKYLGCQVIGSGAELILLDDGSKIAHHFLI